MGLITSFVFGVPFGVLFLIIKNHQVLRSVIPFITINVVNHFAFSKRSTQKLLRYYSVGMPAVSLFVCYSFASS